MIFFTSDTHFSHKMLATGHYRPFTSISEMNETLIHNWNSVVGERDTIYHLGDVSMCGSDETIQIMQQLKGHKILIRGNHDEKTPTFYERCGFSAVLETASIEIDAKSIQMIHDPFLLMNYPIVLHGHYHFPSVENHISQKDGNLIINVCTEFWDFTPVSMRQISTILRKKEFYLCGLKKDIFNVGKDR